MALGIVNYLACSLAMLAVYNYTSAGEELAFLVYYLLSTVISLILNRFVTFRQQHPARNWPVKFVCTVFACYVLTKVVLKTLIDLVLLSDSMQQWFVQVVHTLNPQQLESNIALVVTSLSYCILNYFGQRYYVFRSRA